MAIHVQWKQGYRAKSNAEKVYSELEQIRKTDGDLVPPKVVEAARNPESAMHKEFEWDDGTAGELYRHDQARRMLRAIQVIRVEAPEHKPSRAYSLVTRKKTKETPERRVYTDIAEALQDPVTRQEILSRAINEALSYRRKYAELQELAQVFKAMDDFVEKFQVV